MQTKKIGIVNGGGDCAGLNAVIESVVKSGYKRGFKFIGYYRSFDGILNDQFLELRPEFVDGIGCTGGTILHTTNKGRFSAKTGSGEKKQIDKNILLQTKAKMADQGVEALIVIGGDGTLSAALQLYDVGVNVIGVPKTMDNDLFFTDKTFGFSSAVDYVSDAIDRLRTTANSHDRIVFVETFGRNAGWVALYGGVAGVADAILIPEFPFEYDRLIDQLRLEKKQGKNYSIVVVAEAAKAKGEDVVVEEKIKGHEYNLGGIADKIVKEIKNKTQNEFEMRTVVLGHLLRGGPPNGEDRILAQRYGVGAVNLLENRNYGKMVSLQGNDIKTVDIQKAVSKIKKITKNDSVYQTAKELGIFIN